MEKLENLYSYSQFVNEAAATKHQYTLYVNDEPQVTAGYSTVLDKYEELKETSETGTKLEIFKTKTNTGEEVMQKKKSHIVSSEDKEIKQKREIGEKAKRDLITETILDLFNDVYVPKKSEQISEMEVGKDDNKLEVYLTAYDFVGVAPYLSKNLEAPIKYGSKFYGSPYIIDVSKVVDENGVELTEKSIRRIEKNPKGEEEEETQQNIKLARYDNSGERKYKAIIYIDIKENPDYGKKPKKVKSEEEEEETDEWTEEEKEREREEKEAGNIDPSKVDPDFLSSF